MHAEMMTNLSGVLYSPKIWALVRVGKGEIARRVVNPEPGISILVVFFFGALFTGIGQKMASLRGRPLHSEVVKSPSSRGRPLHSEVVFFPQKEPLSPEGGKKMASLRGRPLHSEVVKSPSSRGRPLHSEVVFFPQKEPLSPEGGEKRMSGSTPGSPASLGSGRASFLKKGGPGFRSPPLREGVVQPG